MSTALKPAPVREIHATIAGVEPGSIAEELGIVSGYRLLEINGVVPEDLIDYRLADAMDSVTLRMLSPEGEEYFFDVDKDPEERIGLGFEYEVFDGVRRCRNKCPFCFVDQMPKGYRDTLYIYDDDYRLSFLGGHFVTLSNLSQRDLDRIVRLRLSPLNVSVHATEEGVRNKILGVRKGRDLLPTIRLLTTKGIELNTQVVVSPGVNDGIHLDQTVEDLAAFFPRVATVAVVPVGLTKHRRHLGPVGTVTRDLARELIGQVDAYRAALQPELKTGFVYAADEMYVIAEGPVPPSEYYDEFPQLENGVGLLRLFEDELSRLRRPRRSQRLQGARKDPVDELRKVTLVTGVAATPWIEKLAKRIEAIFGVAAEVVTVVNRWLGDSVTVAGLMCGEDLRDTLLGRELGDWVFLPAVCVNREGRLLDDMTVSQLSTEIGTPVNAECRWPKEVCKALLNA